MGEKVNEVLIRSLYPRDFVHMLERNCARDFVSGLSCPLLDAGGLLEEVGDGWGLGDEGERAVRLDGDESRDGNSWLDVCCSGVEFLAEVHRFDTSCAESWADGRSRGGLAGLDEDALLKISARTHNITRKHVRPPEHELAEP